MSKSKDFIETELNYDEVLWYRKCWFFILSMLIFMPATIVIGLTGDIYTKRKGIVYKYSTMTRMSSVIGSIVLILFGAFRLFLS